MGQTFKVKLLTNKTEDDGFTDLYIIGESISAFYIPEKKEDFNSINIFHDGGISTILQEPHIEKYLMDRFVKKSIEAK
jgi:hypothetical protein